MDDLPITLDAIEGFIAARQKGLTFPDSLEHRLEHDTRRRRAQRLRAAIPALAIIYNLFLIPDWMLVGDVITIALILHFVVVTPWMLTGRLTKDDSPKLLREGLAASIPIAIALQILVSFVLTSSPDAGHYQYFVLLVVLFTNTIQRLPFRYAVVVSSSIIACHSLAIVISGHMQLLVALVAITTLVVSAYLTLVSNYYLERDGRRAFLLALRDRLRHVEVENASRHDALTDLANRHYLNARLTALWHNGDNAVSPVAMIMLDIDHFKLFNDRYGHVTGDACLKRIAACVSAELRNAEDLAVRYGGEELLILLPKTDVFSAIRIAERIRRSVETLGIPHEGLGTTSIVTASCGAAAAATSTISAPELIATADAALYAAKRNGRNQVWPQFLREGGAAERGPRANVISLGQ